jgi:hypothetical protein
VSARAQGSCTSHSLKAAACPTPTHPLPSPPRPRSPLPTQTDPETIKQVCIKFYKTFPYRALPYPPVRSIYKTMALSQLLWFR